MAEHGAPRRMPASATPSFAHRFEPGPTGWTLLLLHGTGGDENQLLPLGRELVPGAALLSPRGKVLENGISPRFFRRHSIGELDIEDLKRRTDELAAFVRASATERGLNLERVVALGISNGANIAVGLLLRQPDLLRGAALLRPMLPYEPEVTPELAGTDVLIAAGMRDPYAPPEMTERLERTLAVAGARVQTALTSGGHELTEADLESARVWMRELMSGVQPE